MSRIETPLPRQRLHRVLIATLVIIGTAVALLLAHSYEASHPAEGPLSISVEAVQQADATAEVLFLASPTDRDAAPFSDSLALCLSIGLGCVAALLMVLLRLRRLPTVATATPPPSPARRRPVPALTWAPRPALTALCISRV